ncbi:MAG: hypothetical protein ACYC8T_05915 [Myxococcaceae bacterium]
MRLLRLAFFAVSFGPALALGEGVATPGQCTEDFDDCKENCTMEFGTSLNTRDKFGTCMTRCLRTHDDCKERYFDITSNKLDPDALTRKRAKDPAAVEPAARTRKGDAEPKPARRYDPEEELRDDGNAKPTRAREPAPRPIPREEAAPAARSSDEAPVRRTATRMSELGGEKSKPAPEPEPAGEKIDPMLSSEPDPMLAPAESAKSDKEPERAEPAKRAREPDPEPEPAPPPKARAERRAIDDWAPGDSPAAPPAKKDDSEPPPPPPKKSKPPEKKRAIDDWDPNE